MVSVKTIAFLGLLEWRNLFGPKSKVAIYEKLVFRSGVGYLFLFVLTDVIFKNSHIWELCRESFGFLGFLALAYNAESTYKRTNPYIWFYQISHILTQCFWWYLSLWRRPDWLDIHVHYVLGMIFGTFWNIQKMSFLNGRTKSDLLQCAPPQAPEYWYPHIFRPNHENPGWKLSWIMVEHFRIRQTLSKNQFLLTNYPRNYTLTPPPKTP